VAAAADFAQHVGLIRFVIPTDGSVELAFEPGADHSLSATATIAVGNDDIATALVEFYLIDTDSGARIGSPSATAAAGPPPAIVLTAEPLAIDAGRIETTTFTVSAPASTKKLKALLVAEAAGVGSATLPIAASFPSAVNPFAAAEPVPASKTITLSRSLPSLLQQSNGCWWFWPPSTASDWSVRVDGVGNVPAGVPIAEPATYLTSDRGGSLPISLSRDPNSGGRLEVGCADRAGVYKGTLAFDPDSETAKSLDLTVNVQDLFVWPLLVALAGSYVVWRYKDRTDRTRPKRVLRIAIEDARKRYISAHPAGTPGLLDSVFDGGVALPDGRGAAADLYRLIGTARTKEELDDSTTATKDLITLVDLAPAIEAVRGELRKQIEEGPLAALSDATPIRTAGAGLWARDSLDSLDEATDHLAALKSQVEANVEWLRAFELCRLVQARYASLPQPIPPTIADRVLLADPRAIRAAYLRPATSLDDLTEPSVIEMLRERLVIIEAARLAATPKVPPPPHPADAPHPAAVDELVPSILAQIQMPFLPSGSTPEHKLAWLRIGDSVEFVVVAVIAALVFLQSAYVDKAFGTSWQYVAAFATGAGGTIAINFALLPWYRSYRASGGIEES
jgi:hypothetical protein